MADPEKLFLFICSTALNEGAAKLSYRIASKLEMMGIAAIGNLQNLSAQRTVPFDSQKKMIFINGCRSGCLRMLTHGFNTEKYLFINVSAYLNSSSFNIENYIHTEILPKISEKWNYSLSHSIDSKHKWFVKP